MKAEVPYKVCSFCGDPKPVSEFYFRDNSCKTCRCDSLKERRRQAPNKTKLVTALDGEEWKDFYGYEGLYRISSFGRVTSLCKSVLGEPRPRLVEKLLKPFLNSKTGYWGHVLSSYDGRKDKSFRVHREVAKHFIPNPNNLPEVNHLNGKDDNRAASLEWVSRSENVRHAFRTGLTNPAKGASHPKAKMTEETVLYIFNSKVGSRQLSRELGIPHSNIMNIRGGYNWNSVTGMPYRNKRISYQ